MVEKSEGQYGRLQRFILLVFFGGWIGAVVAFALFMRAWIPDVDLKADLAAIEAADTDEANLDRPLPPALQPLTGPLPAFPVSGSVYVPLYSSLYVGGQRSLKNLSATLSLRNTSADQALIVTSVTYFDGNGKAVVELLDVPHVLAPMATAEFYADQSSTSGGPVATVIVGWGAETSVAPPLIEAVILGNYGVKSISFVSRGESRP
jgi:hypothetical protein